MAAKPILFISPLSPPHGGIATWTEKLIHYGLPDGTPISLVDTRIQGARHLFAGVNLSWRECHRTVSIFTGLLHQLIWRRPKLVHLSCSVSPTGIFRDLLCALLVRLFMLPVVSHYHANLPDFASKRYLGLSGWALRTLLRIAHLNIVENQVSLVAAEQLLSPAKRATICLLTNFIEDDIFERPMSRPRAVSDRYQAIFVGGITRAKGCAHILSLARRRPDIDFHLYGVLHEDMAPLFADAPTNVLLHGAVDHEKLLDAMCHYDFLVFPSYTEGFPLTVLEAMSLGLAIVATRVGAIPEMIDEGSGGYLVAPGDEDALLTAVNRLTASPQLLLTMGAYNKEKSANCYRYSVVVKKMMACYAALIGEVTCVV